MSRKITENKGRTIAGCGDGREACAREDVVVSGDIANGENAMMGEYGDGGVIEISESMLEEIICEIAETSYEEVSTKRGIAEETIHERIKEAGLSLRPSAIQQTAIRLQNGQSLRDITVSSVARAYTPEDYQYMVKYYKRFKSLSKTARYFRSNTVQVKQACLLCGLSEDEIKQNSIDVHFDKRKIVMFNNINSFKFFDDAYNAAAYVLEYCNPISCNIHTVVGNIQQSCRSSTYKAYNRKWCYFEDYEHYIEQHTVHTPEPSNRQVLCGIYIVRNDVNDKVYIGKTTISFKNRWEKHKNMSHNERIQTPFYKAIRAIGFEHFTFHILEIINTNESNKVFLAHERKWIKYYHADDPQFGYNSDEPVDTEQTDLSVVMNVIIELLQGIPSNEIASKHDISAVVVSSIKTGRTHRFDNIEYPIQCFDEQYRFAIAQILFRLLTETDLTFETISRILDVTLSTVSEFNNGKSQIAHLFDSASFPIRKQPEPKKNINDNENKKKTPCTKNKRPKRENHCIVCHQPISPSAKMCSACAHKANRTMDLERQELQDLIFDLSFKDIGEMFGITDRAVARQCRRKHLPYTLKLVELGKQLGWEYFCNSFEEDEEKYLAMTKNNHRSQVPAEDIIEMYTNQKMNIIEISQHTNKCCEVIRKILREHNIPIKTHPASRQVRCIELDIVYDSITLMADFLIQSQYLNDTTAHTAASAIGQSIRHPEQYDGYKGYHFEFIE